jgi:hypothetical protein
MFLAELVVLVEEELVDQHRLLLHLVLELQILVVEVVAAVLEMLLVELAVQAS